MVVVCVYGRGCGCGVLMGGRRTRSNYCVNDLVRARVIVRYPRYLPLLLTVYYTTAILLLPEIVVIVQNLMSEILDVFACFT